MAVRTNTFVAETPDYIEVVKRRVRWVSCVDVLSGPLALEQGDGQ